MVVDQSESKRGTEFPGYSVLAPADIVDRQSEFDYLICANYNHTEEIRIQAVELGIEPSKLLLITEI